MMNENTQTTYIPITKKPLKKLIDEQLNKFTLDSIHANKLFAFDPKGIINKLHAHEGQRVLSGDFGGDKGVTKLFVVQKGHLVISPDYEDYVQGNDGEGYIESLEKTAAYAIKHNIPVGLSWGTPLSGTIPTYHPKAKIFLEKLALGYSSDFKNLLPTLKSCLNDGPAGAISAVIETNRQSSTTSLIFSINGGGLGMSVFHDGSLYLAESGHVEAIEGLNTYNQHIACGVNGANYVCVERLGANKAGIEAQWTQLRGETLHAREIEDLYKAGDELAGDLYDHSAYVVAHYILGTANAFGVDLTNQKTMIVGHGGAYKFPFYGERVQQLLELQLGAKPQLIMAKDYGNKDSNACLDGAAIATFL